MRTNFDCQYCHTTFSIDSDFLLKKDEVVCPSCGCKVSDNVFQNLKSGIASIVSAQKIQVVEASSSPKCVTFKLENSDT